MNSKERVRAAICHRPVDRIPMDYEATEVVTRRLMKEYGYTEFEQLMQRYQTDIRWFDPVPSYTGRELKKTMAEDGVSYYQEDIMGYTKYYFWNGVDFNWMESDPPLAGELTRKKIENHLWPNPDLFRYEEVKRFCDHHPDRAIGMGRPGFFQTATRIRGFEQLMMDFYLEPELTHLLINKIADVETEIYSRMFEAGEGRVDILRTCDDYGTQISLLMAPEVWDEFFAHNTRKFTALCHQNNAFFMQHSCGAVRPVIQRLIDCGVDCLDPIQKVAGLEPQGLKDDFGKKICFHGGIDTQWLLPKGTPEEVYQETMEYIRILNQDGGYILISSQMLEPDVPTANIEAMYRAGLESKTFASL